MAEKVYRGDRTIDCCLITVDGRPIDEALSVRTFSNQGLEWSYEGEGPLQLALAILVDHLGDPDQALELSDGFMRAVIANFSNEWEMTSADIDRALAHLAERDSMASADGGRR